MEAEVEHMTETIALASNVRMLMKKHRRKKREIIAKLILKATARTKMMVMMTAILAATMIMRKAIAITEMAETMKGDQEMERKTKMKMHRFQEWKVIIPIR